MHPLNVTHLVLGLVALGVAGLWTADSAGWVAHEHYLFPIVLIGAGGIGLLAFASRGVASSLSRRTPAEAYAAPTDEDGRGIEEDRLPQA